MAIVTGESFVQFWFFVYSRVMLGEIRLVTLHHLKKSLLLPPLFWGDSWSLSVNHCECSEWPLSKAVYFNHPVLTANTSIHIIPLVWWKLSVEVFNQGKPWSKRGRNWPKTTPLKSQGQCVLGVCWKVRINECTFRGFLQASFCCPLFTLSGCVEQKSVTGSIHQAPSHHILDSCGNVVLLLECTGHYHFDGQNLSVIRFEFWRHLKLKSLDLLFDLVSQLAR